MISDIRENVLIGELTKSFLRSPSQRNGLHETDAEIIRISDSCVLAVTTDSIVEEISSGLYSDPYLAGWMAVMASMSDLSAVGAQPNGILISEILPTNYPEADRDQLQLGIQDACRRCETCVLGGDTNCDKQLILTGTAIGTCPDGRFLTRRGSRPGDFLFSTGSIGIGNAFAAKMLLNPKSDPLNRISYRPTARLKEGRALLGSASACMDTSDGVIATLDQMMRLNGTGFDLRADWESVLDPGAAEFASGAGIPTWLLLAGQHGEFELLFTVPQSRVHELYDKAEFDGWQPVFLGLVNRNPAITITLYGENRALDSGSIRNFATDLDGNVQEYYANLLNMDSEVRKGGFCHVNH
ncbi:MAG TPA: thiamine-phosphate kinase [Bacteroidota bacterium]|nr:thiamine-phosphate kinase [Bacteroidota bacterium]